ncbi:MAG: hypothetical protein Q9211_004011 [Gyalolechia sp. 1 TL-2023]
MALTTVAREGSEIEIFRDIDNYVQQHHDLDADKEPPTIARFAEAKATYPFMKDITYAYYTDYWCRIAMDAVTTRHQSTPAYSASEFWHKLYHDPLTNVAEINAFCVFLNYSYFADIEIGRLDGETPLRLAPGAGLINDGEDLFDDLDWADDGASAVSYAEGHPSEEEVRLVSPNDGLLRRFWEVGYILWNMGTGWKKTGHVLVLDVEKGRDRHPWIMLAKTWETDDDEPKTITVPDRVRKGDRSAFGVFPGNQNRTTVAKLVPISSDSRAQSTPVLKRMGSNFTFRLQRSGKTITRQKARSQYGPDLARAMTWLKRPSGEEVCFDKRGIEYMTCDPITGTYSYPSTAESRHRKPVTKGSLQKP